MPFYGCLPTEQVYTGFCGSNNLHKHKLICITSHPTTKHDTTIDHIYTNITQIHSADSHHTYYSDHDLIHITINTK